MTTPVGDGASSPISTLLANSATPVTAGATSAANNSGFDSDTFLQLLIAQLKYQNPMSPTDPSDLLTQSAQLYSVQTLTEMLQAQQSAANDQATLTGTSLIGKTVTATSPAGVSVQGVAVAVHVSAEGPQVDLQATDGTTTRVALSAITTVSAPPSAQPDPSSGDPAGNQTGN